MQTKYKGTLTFIGTLIVICLAIGIAYLFYDKVTNLNTEVIVEEELSTNYLNGSTINRSKEYTFSVTNNGPTDVYYDIKVYNIKNYRDNIKYSLTSKDTEVNILDSVMDFESNILADNILISAGSTQNFSFKIANNSETTFNLQVKKINNPEEYFYSTILKNNKINKLKTKPGEEVSNKEEGLIEDYDDNGVIYYFRGVSLNNYVKFAGLLWRIVKINSDGTVKLVLNNTIEDLTSYHSNAEYEKLDSTDIMASLKTYYDIELKHFDDYIANSKYCIENSYNEENSSKVYTAYTRLIINKIPTSNCLGTKETYKIGLLTADEVILAGANSSDNNTAYYLYNKEIENSWWTFSLAENKDNNLYPFIISPNGKVEYSTSSKEYRGLRPVINLIRKTTVTGLGTIDNPYIVKTN